MTKMHKFKTPFCFFTVLLAVSLFFWGSLVLAEGTLGPKIVLEEYVYDFDEVLEGTVVQHAFKVLNQGDQILEIKNVRPG